jgi:dihydrolipoamide dehydrogenase
MNQTFDYIVIGAGPGGVEAALEIRRQNRSVLLIEKDKWGGTCLHQGCIPTKALLHASKQPFAGDLLVLFADVFAKVGAISATLVANLERAGVMMVTGEATIIDRNQVSVNRVNYEAENIIFAGGSAPISLKIPGIDATNIYDSESIYSLTTLPKRLAIIGGGYIGFEWATIFTNLGSEVVIYEALPTVLSGFDDDLVRRYLTLQRHRHWTIKTNSRVLSFSEKDGQVDMATADGEATYDAVMVAVGRKPLDIAVPDGVIKIGDAAGAPLLAHKASAEAKALFSHDFQERVIPAAMFTDPEIAVTGSSEKTLKAQGKEYLTVKLPYRANAKAFVTGHDEGYVKLIYDCQKAFLLGAALIGHLASDVINVLTLAIQEKIPIAKLKRLVFPHPTIGEVIGQALDSI